MKKEAARLKPANVQRRQITLRDTKRRLIVDGARRAFEKHGLEGASVRLIAIEAGCTTGAIYPYFNGKEEIYAAILSESLESLNRFAVAQVEAARGPLKRARAGLKALYTYYKTNPAEISLGLYLFRGPGVRLSGLTPSLDRGLNAQLRAAIEVASGAIRAAGFANAAELAADGFCHAVGLLIMEQTGRLKVLGSVSEPLMDRHLIRLLSD
jgi:TetR/AcrR family transcriptional regulator